MKTFLFLSVAAACAAASLPGCAGEHEPEPVRDELSLLSGALCDHLGTCRAAEIETWPTAAAAERGLDGTQLDAATRVVAENGGHCLLVVRDGALVHEAYRNGADARAIEDSWSIAKTFTSALVGVAIAEGRIEGPDDPASRYLPEWRDDPAHASILLRHLLSGVSGLGYWPTLGMSIDVGDYSWLLTHDDLDDAAIRHPTTAPPETLWRYNNHAVQALGPVLARATGVDAEAYARDHLWGPIGMSLPAPGDPTSGTHWRKDRTNHPVMYSSVFATCRGFAKLGQLLLQRGQWEGRQLVDRAYVDRMLAPSQAQNRAYGFLTWLNQGPPAIGNTNEPFDGVPFPEAPADLVSAQGVGQNFVDVIPSRGLVIVHLRPPAFLDPPQLLADGKQALHRRILASVLAADRGRP